MNQQQLFLSPLSDLISYNQMRYFAWYTPPFIRQATRPGDKLLVENTCRLCRSETDLLQMIDTFQKKGANRV